MAVLHISCAVQGTYVPHCAAMLHAAMTSSPEHVVRAHVLHGPDLPRRAADRIAGMARAVGGEAVFHEIADDRVAGLPEAGYFTSAMWYRIFLPELLPAVDRVLYLDVDTLVRRDLAPLWDLDLAGRLLGAVTNVFEPFRAHRPAELGLAGPEAYFNSGVLLLHLDELRAAGATQRLRRFAVERGPELLWPDQDALNVVLGEGRVRLDPTWNAMNAVMNFAEAEAVFAPAELAAARANPAIRHFEGPGPNKPWHAACTQPQREEYFAHRRQTPWPRARLEGVPRRALMTRARQCLMPMRPV